MSKSTPIVLSATAISFTNEWWHTNKPNFKIIMAGLGVSLFFDGIEKLNEKAAVGIATIMLVSVLLTPIDGQAPFETIASLVSTPEKKNPHVKEPGAPGTSGTPGQKGMQ